MALHAGYRKSPELLPVQRPLPVQCGSASPFITMNRSGCGSRHHNHSHENFTLEVCRCLYRCHTQPLACSFIQSGKFFVTSTAERTEFPHLLDNPWYTV